MVGDIFDEDGAEGAHADVQRHECVRDSREEFGREVQARGRRGHSAGFAGEDRLVAHVVRRLRLALEVRRQRDFAVLFQVHRAEEFDDALALRLDAAHDACHFADMHKRAEAHLASGLHEALPRVRAAGHGFEEEQLDPPVIGKGARRDHARVVQHHEVAALQKGREVREHPVLDALLGAVQHHHAGSIASLGGVAHDEFLGQSVIVIGGAKAHRVAKVPRCVRDVHFRMRAGMNREAAKERREDVIGDWWLVTGARAGSPMIARHSASPALSLLRSFAASR